MYQLYLADDEDWMGGLIRRAQIAGYNGFCLTVDTQVYSRRERDILKPVASAVGRRGDDPCRAAELPGPG